MSSSRFITLDFKYHRPTKLRDALQMLQDQNGSKVLAGGTDLLIQIKTGEHKPQSIVQILDIEELNVIDYSEGLRIGAGVRLYQLEEDEQLARNYTALHDAVKSLGSTQVRNMATIGGNICNASPSADTATPLMVIGAEAEITRLTGQGNIESNRVPMDKFFTGPGTTLIRPDELLCALILPKLSADSGSAFVKIGRVTLDMAKISCSVFIERNGSEIRTVRVALGGAAPRPVRAVHVERALIGQEMGQDSVEDAARKVSESIAPITDIRSTAEYRREVSSILIRDVVFKAWRRAGGEAVG
jgi:carbon-monoxide dehydrogenase medium subunit